MMKDQKGCICAEEEQITAARAKQHEDEEEDTDIRPKKTKSGVLHNVMQDQKGCKKNNIRTKEEQTTAARTKQHGRRGRRYRHKAGGEGKKREQREKTRQQETKQASKTTSVNATASRSPH